MLPDGREAEEREMETESSDKFSFYFVFLLQQRVSYTFKTSLLIPNPVGMDKEEVVSLIGLASMSDWLGLKLVLLKNLQWHVRLPN